MKFISSIILLVALQMFSAKGFRGANNITLINNIANSNTNALAVNAGVCGNANANAISAATNANRIRLY